MTIADRLFAEAKQIAAQFQRSVPNLQKEILDLEAKTQEKKLILHSARSASQRASDFVAQRGANFYCPRCWVEKEQPATVSPMPNDGMRCDSCGVIFQV